MTSDHYCKTWNRLFEKLDPETQQAILSSPSGEASGEFALQVLKQAERENPNAGVWIETHNQSKT